MEFLLDAVNRFPLREEFAGSLDHLDPVPLAGLPRIDGTRVEPADSIAGSGCGHRIDSANQGRPDADEIRTIYREGESGGTSVANHCCSSALLCIFFLLSAALFFLVRTAAGRHGSSSMA